MDESLDGWMMIFRVDFVFHRQQMIDPVYTHIKYEILSQLVYRHFHCTHLFVLRLDYQTIRLRIESCFLGFLVD